MLQKIAIKKPRVASNFTVVVFGCDIELLV